MRTTDTSIKMRFSALFVLLVCLYCVEGYSFKRSNQNVGLDPEFKEALIKISVEIVRDQLGNDAAKFMKDVYTICLNRVGQEKACFAEKAKEICILSQWTQDSQNCKDIVNDFESIAEFVKDTHDNCADKLDEGIDAIFTCVGPVAEAHCDNHRVPEECRSYIKTFEEKARELFPDGKCDNGGGRDQLIRDALINIGTELTRDEFGDDVADIVHDVLSDCINKRGDEKKCLEIRAYELCKLASWSSDSQECKDLVADFVGAGELGADIKEKCSDSQSVDEAFECAGPVAEAHCDQHRNPQECHEFLKKIEAKTRELYQKTRMLRQINQIRALLKKALLRK